MLCVKVNSRLDRNAEMTRKTCASVYRGIKSRGLGRDVDVIAHVHPLAPPVSPGDLSAAPILSAQKRRTRQYVWGLENEVFLQVSRGGTLETRGEAWRDL